MTPFWPQSDPQKDSGRRSSLGSRATSGGRNLEIEAEYSRYTVLSKVKMRKCLQSITEAGHLRESHHRGFLQVGGRIHAGQLYADDKSTSWKVVLR